MNANQIINMIIRRVMNIAINKGVDAGMNQFSKARGTGQPGQAEQQPMPQPGAQDAGKRARQAARLTRKIGRL